MSSRRVNSLKLMVRCLRAVRRDISLILLRLLPWRFNTWRRIYREELRKAPRVTSGVRRLTVIWLRTLARAT